MSKKRSPRKADLDFQEFQAFLNNLKKESDRGMVLISGALLDDLLERCICSLLLDHPRVNQLFESGPLGSLSSRALMAFLLGILSDSEYQECERVRKVRNFFAHEVGCTFQTQKVKDICSSFSFIANTEGGDSRSHFLASAIALFLALWKRPSHVSQRRLTYVKPE